MHIAVFNRSFYPDTAATGQLLTELCEGLVRDHGCRISVVAGVPLIPATAQVTPGFWELVTRENYRGIEIFRGRGTRFPKQRFVGRATNYVTYFLSACYAGQWLDRPDIVVAATDPPIVGLAAYLAARRFGVPLVMSYRDIFPEVAALLEDFHSPTINFLLQKVNCFLVRHADRNVALGDTMRRRLIEGKGADPQRTIIIPDWADCREIVPVPRHNLFSRTHDLDDKFVVMHSGNMGLSQSLESLIDAADRLRHVSDIRFVFVGEGVKKQGLQERAKRLGLTNVLFLPYQPKDQLRESFGAADVFLVSLKRGLAGYITPSKLYGILAAGRAYVAAVEEDSEVTAITRKYECGLLADPGNPEQIADRVLSLYHDRSLLERYGKNARNAAFDFDKPAQIHAYFRLFQQLLEAS